MNYPIRIKRKDGQLLHAQGVGEQEIEVREDNGLRWMHFGGEAIQAMMIVDEPAKPIIPYQIAMLTALLFNQDPEAILNLGVGGGSFERFFSRYLSGAEITSVESSSDVITLLLDYFTIPQTASVINDDAAQFLLGCDQNFDLILCDIFDHSDHPPCLLSNRFYADACRCLSGRGVFVVNLLPDTEEELLNILLAVRASFEPVLMLEVPYFKNIILFCLKQDSPEKNGLKLRCRELFASSGIDLSDIPDMIVELPKRRI